MNKRAGVRCPSIGSRFDTLSCSPQNSHNSITYRCPVALIELHRRGPPLEPGRLCIDVTIKMKLTHYCKSSFHSPRVYPLPKAAIIGNIMESFISRKYVFTFNCQYQSLRGITYTWRLSILPHICVEPTFGNFTVHTYMCVSLAVCEFFSAHYCNPERRSLVAASVAAVQNWRSNKFLNVTLQLKVFIISRIFSSLLYQQQ